MSRLVRSAVAARTANESVIPASLVLDEAGRGAHARSSPCLTQTRPLESRMAWKTSRTGAR